MSLLIGLYFNRQDRLKIKKSRIGENRQPIESLFIHRLCLHGARHQVIFLFPTSRGGVPLFLVPPFVFISGSRGTLTATCRACCGHVFLSSALSSFSCFSSFQCLEDTMRLTPILEGLTPGRRETRPESLAIAGWQRYRVRPCDGTRVTRARPLWLYYIIFPRLSFPQFAFIIYVCAPSSIYSPFFNIFYLIVSVFGTYFSFLIANESINEVRNKLELKENL